MCIRIKMPPFNYVEGAESVEFAAFQCYFLNQNQTPLSNMGHLYRTKQMKHGYRNRYILVY